MTTQALYNKWRGQTFADILGQEHITRTLQNQIKAGRIGHAYLFTGLRGTGKTSTARIMAKAVNCVGQTDDPPCNQCHICRAVTEGRALDLIEIDAASNRGIDEIRALRDRVNFAPSESRYKVYVIDEVHMLTNEAFNALLKTLEEPPAHVIFILCTTEPYRLPDTVLSRCQRFDFRRGTLPVLIQNLRHICEEEHIAIAPDALEYIARQAAGSFRDGVSLLDQLAAYDAGEVTLELVQRVLGSASASLVARLARSLLGGDIAVGLYAIDEALNQGAEPRQFLSEILDYLRALMLVRVGSPDSLGYLGSETLAEMRQDVQTEGFSLGRLIRAIKLFNEAGQSLRTATHPRLPLELAFVEAALTPADAARTDAVPLNEGQSAAGPARMVREAAPAATPPAPLPARQETPVAAEDIPIERRATATLDKVEAVESMAAESPPAPQNVAIAPSAAVQSESTPDAPPVASETGKLSLEWVQGNWELVLIKIKPQSNQVRALLNSAYPLAVEGDKVILACEADFHREKLMEGKRQSLIEQVLSEVVGSPCRVECVVKPLPQDRDVAPDRATARRGQNGLFNAPSATPPEPPAASLPVVPATMSPDARTELLNHPAVKKLQKLGGRVSQVIVPDQGEKKEDKRGQ